jgi:hypothetical protein
MPIDTNEISPYSYLGGCVQNKNVGRAIAQFDDFVADGSKACNLMMWSRKKKQWHHFTLGWTVIGLVATKTQMLALGADGTIFIADMAGTREEQILDGQDCEFKNLAVIGGRIYAFGSGPQVFRRDGDALWSAYGEGFDASASSKDVCINAIDGSAESELYAVGDAGRIWRFKGDKWQEMESPTQNNLHAVKVVKPGLVYAVGDSGTLLRGNGDSFEVLAQEATESDLTDLALFMDRLYMVVKNAIFTLESDDTLLPRQIIRGGYVTCNKLATADGVLWSFGPKHIVWTEDGKKWQEVTPGATEVETAGDENQGDGCGCGDHGQTGSAIQGAMHIGGGGQKAD